MPVQENARGKRAAETGWSPPVTKKASMMRFVITVVLKYIIERFFVIVHYPMAANGNAVPIASSVVSLTFARHLQVISDVITIFPS
jgi:hypothetical protein